MVDAVQNSCELLPYSQLVLEMEQQMPGVYDFPFRFCFDAQKVDVERLKKAIAMAIANHTIFHRFGKQYYDIKVWTKEGIGYCEGHLNRILGDVHSAILLIDDIGRAYLGLPLEKDNYEAYMRGYLDNQLTERYMEHKSRMEERYGWLSCPVRPTLDYPLGEEAKWLRGEMVIKTGGKVHPKLSTMQQVCLATTIAIMDYCGTDEAALTWAYLGREKEIDQHIFGSLHKDIPMRIHRAEKVDDYIRQVRNECRQGIACSDYPITLTPPYTETWNYAVNVLEQPNLKQALAELPFALRLMPIDEGKDRLAYSLLDIEAGDGQLAFKYSASHYKKESMERFARMVAERMECI